MACTPKRCIIRRGWPSRSGPARTATTSSRSAASRASSGSTSRSGRWPTSIAALRLVIAGDGTQRANTERLVDSLGLGDRVTFLGAVDDRTLLDLYAGALGVVYAPFDEDFGYVTLEAFLARKPVITATDAGGPLEFVVDGVNGAIAEPEPEAVGAAFARLHADRAYAAGLGDAGHARASEVTWHGVIDRLVGA